MNVDELTVENGWIPAFLGECADGMRIALENGKLDTSGERPVMVYVVVTGTVRDFRRVEAIPHNYIEYRLNSGHFRRSRPDRKVWIKTDKGA